MAGRKVNVVVKGSAWEFSNSEKIGKGKYWHSGERSTSQLFSKEEEENQMCLLFSATEVRLVNGQGRKSLQGAELGICLFKIISFSLSFFKIPSFFSKSIHFFSKSLSFPFSFSHFHQINSICFQVVPYWLYVLYYIPQEHQSILPHGTQIVGWTFESSWILSGSFYKR